MLFGLKDSIRMATTGTLIAGIDRFNPVSKLKAQNASMTPRWLELSQGRESMSLAELRVQNAYWFKQPISFPRPVRPRLRRDA